MENKIVVEVIGLEKESEIVKVVFDDGSYFWMQHFQDCCENVRLSDFDGDETDLVGGVWYGFDESSQEGDEDDWGTSTWTFYTLKSSKGYIWLRWLGESNGYYSESVSCGYSDQGETPDRW